MLRVKDAILDSLSFPFFVLRAHLRSSEKIGDVPDF